MGAAGLAPPVELVETSPVLRHAQAERVRACWHDAVATLPTDGPLLVVANEFFDALPIRQFDAKGEELNVVLEREGFGRAGEVASERCVALASQSHGSARRSTTQAARR